MSYPTSVYKQCVDSQTATTSAKQDQCFAQFNQVLHIVSKIKIKYVLRTNSNVNVFTDTSVHPMRKTDEAVAIVMTDLETIRVLQEEQIDSTPEISSAMATIRTETTMDKTSSSCDQ